MIISLFTRSLNVASRFWQSASSTQQAPPGASGLPSCQDGALPSVLVALRLRLCEVAGANSRLPPQMTIPLLSSCLPGDPPTLDESSAAAKAVTGRAKEGLLACLPSLHSATFGCSCSIVTIPCPTHCWSRWSCDTRPPCTAEFPAYTARFQCLDIA